MPTSMGKLHGVPDLPTHYLPREADLGGLKRKLLAEGALLGISVNSSAIGVQGMGGIGKSVLAAALAHDPEVRLAFPDGIYWLTIGQKPNLLDLQSQLLRRLTGAKETSATEQEAKDALREAFEGKAVLLVLDDAWTIDHADAFSVTAAPGRLLITTRNLENRQILKTFEGHLGQVYGLAIAPDDHQVISASADRTVRVWDLESGRTVHILEGHADAVFAVAMPPTGAVLYRPQLIGRYEFGT
jgi:NB-ARC domain/WD domain, G-beta repeat